VVIGLATRKRAHTESAADTAAATLKHAAERETEIERQIRQVEAEHAKRVEHVRGYERDLEEAINQRRIMETRRDTIGDPDPAGLDRKIAATITRENELRGSLAAAREAVQGTPSLLASLRGDKSAARATWVNAERASCRQIVLDAAHEIVELEPTFRRILELQTQAAVARSRDEDLRRDSSVCPSPNTPAPGIIPEELWFGPEVGLAAEYVRTNRALLR
jgi:hypothetical protein